MKTITRSLLVLFMMLTAVGLTLSQNPKSKPGTFVLTNATIVTITNGVINNGSILIRNGKIEDISTNLTVPTGAEVVNCTGLRVYPGMIDGGTQLGLSEVGSDAKTQDYHETGDVIPQMKALTAINPNSTLIPVARVNGITTVLARPDGGLFPGTAALVDLLGYTPDQMYAGFEGVVMNFPNTGRNGSFDQRSAEEITKAADKSLKILNEVWDKAIQYAKLDSTTGGKDLEYYPEMEALLPVVRGDRNLLIEVNTARDILSSIKWIQERKIKKAILTGVAEGWRVAGSIAKANLPVITGPVVTLPSRNYDRYDQAYANAGMLRKAGVKVAIRSNDSENVRNLPYHAGFAAAYGMDKEEALRAVTIVPAQIFGVDDKLGSIEKGKIANLFVCDGDPFEPKTQVKYVFVGGWKMSMVTRQTLLYDEFLKREPGLSKN